MYGYIFLKRSDVVKLQFKNQKTENAFYAFLAAAASILFFFIILNIGTLFSWLGELWNMLLPLVYGFVLAYVLNSPMNFFENKVFKFLDRKKPRRKLRRTLAVVITVILALVVVTAFVAIIAPQLYQSIVTLVNNATSYIHKAEELIAVVANWLNLSEEAIAGVNNWINDIAKNIVNQLKEWLPSLLPTVIDFSKVMISGIADIIIGIVLCVYLLYNKETYFAKLKKAQYAFLPENIVDKIINVAHESHSIFTGFIVGKLLDSLMVAVICLIGCLILGVPFELLISVIVGVCNIIPVFGPVIATCITGFIVLVIDPLKAIWYLIFLIVLFQVDGNIIEPKILGDSTGLSAFWVMIAILVGGGLFGFIGMFIGVPTFAVLYSLFKKLMNKRLKKKGMSTNIKDYASEKHKIL